MGIRYYKLFDLLNRRNMKKSDLRQILSSSTVAKLSKGEYISGEAIEKICIFLKCQPADIMEVVYNESKTETYEIYQTNHINESLLPDLETIDTVTHLRENGNSTILDVEEKYDI